MLDLSWAEIGVIVVTAALAIGPKDLPVVMRKVARGWGKFKRFGTDLRRQFDESPLGAELRAAQAEVEREARTIYDDQGVGYESFSLDGIPDASRRSPMLDTYQGPTPHTVPPSLIPEKANVPPLTPQAEAPKEGPPPLSPLVIAPPKEGDVHE